MREILLIGYGNPLRGDDGAGQAVAERLGELIDGRSLRCIPAHQLLPEMAEAISEARFVYFVDAEVGAEPGEIVRRVVEASGTAGDAHSHHFTPGGLLQVAVLLYGRCPPAALITIGGEAFDEPDRLSAVVETAVAAVVSIIAEEVQHIEEENGELRNG